MHGRIEERVADRIAEDPGRVYCRFEGISVSRGQFGDLVALCRKSLEASGFKEGNRIVTLLPNCPLMLALSTAVWQLHGAVVPMSHIAGLDMTLEAIKLVDPFAIISLKGIPQLEAFAHKIETAGYPVTLVSLNEPFPLVKGHARSYEDPSIAVIFATSGTTGLPKAVALTHENILANIYDTCEHVSLLLNQPHIALNLLPNFHTFGFCLTSLLCLTMGYCQVLLPSFMPPSRALQALCKEDITIMVGVPTIIAMLCEAIERAHMPPPQHLVKIVCGGAPTNARLYERAKKFLGVNLHEGYGLTECSPMVAASHDNQGSRSGFIGPLLSEYQWQLRTPDGTPATGNEGVLWLKGPSICNGYFRSPEATKQRFDADGWFNTGDVIRTCDDGYIQILDRSTDIVIVDGFNVYPQEVENCLGTHPAVLESAVVGSPNALSGEIVKAFVVLKPTVPAPTERELLNYCKERLAHYKTPRKLEFLAELPRSPIGKVLRRKLRDLERQRFEERQRSLAGK